MGLLDRSPARATCATSPPTSWTSSPTRSATSWSARAPARGGHLGPNLGVVELTLALHRVFDSPQDRIVFDTGHQAYVHKILTGRAAGFDNAAAGGRPLRLPQPGRVRARRRRELPRLDRAVVRRRARQGVLPPRRGAARRRRDRRRCAHRRHGLGGAEQHRRRRRQRRPPAGDRGQRQRPLLHPDRRRPRQPPHRAAHQTPATSRCSTRSSGGSTASAASARRSTTPCTR